MGLLIAAAFLHSLLQSVQSTALVPYISREIDTDCSVVDEIDLGRSKTLLFETESGEVGYAVFHKCITPDRWSSEKLFVFADREPSMREMDVVDSGWHLYVLQFTDHEITVVNKTPFKGGYVNGLRTAAVNLFVFIIVLLAVRTWKRSKQ